MCRIFSESLLIGIERWQFVESDVNELAKILNPALLFDVKCFSLSRERTGARIGSAARGKVAAAATKSAE
jgi:hypothetical protein